MVEVKIDMCGHISSPIFSYLLPGIDFPGAEDAWF